jgi:hypothetical protein
MVVRLFPTIKLEVQFLDLLQILKQRHTIEVNSKKTFPTSSNGHGNHRTLPAHVIASSSLDLANGYSSNSNSPTATNGQQNATIKPALSERSQMPQRIIAKGPPMKSLKREAKYFPTATIKSVVFS